MGLAVTDVALYAEASEHTIDQITHFATVFWGCNTWFVVALTGMLSPDF